jgi:hypothetical protein
MQRSNILSGDDAIVAGTAHSFVILNLFQDNMRPWFVILKQVQDDERWGEGVGSTAISGDDAIVAVIQGKASKEFTRNSR